MNAVIYIRTLKSARSRWATLVGLEAQCRSFCTSLGYQIINVFLDAHAPGRTLHDRRIHRDDDVRR